MSQSANSTSDLAAESAAIVERLWHRLMPQLTSEIRRIQPLGTSTRWHLVAEPAPAPAEPVNPMPQRVAEGLVAVEEILRFVPQGRLRLIHFGQEVGSCADTVGCRYIHALIEKPGSPIAAIVLKAAIDGRETASFRGSSGTMADTEALRNLERRYQELQEDLDDAVQASNHQRQEAIEKELEQLATTLRAIVGRGGKGRVQSDGERIRIAVTNAIRRTLWKMERGGANRAAAYFRRTIRTGSFLCFLPEGSEHWALA